MYNWYDNIRSTEPSSLHGSRQDEVKQKHPELQLWACEEMMMLVYDMNTGNVMVMLLFFPFQFRKERYRSTFFLRMQARKHVFAEKQF